MDFKPYKLVAEGPGKTLKVIDGDGRELTGIVGVQFVALAEKGVECKVLLVPGEMTVEANDTKFYLIDPVSGEHRQVASIVWGPDAKGKQEVWKP
jgi:hypothetical protein